jgi:hypothetical protein
MRHCDLGFVGNAVRESDLLRDFDIWQQLDAQTDTENKCTAVHQIAAPKKSVARKIWP